MQYVHSLNLVKKDGDSDWKQALRTAFRDPFELLDYLSLDEAQFKEQVLSDPSFKMLVPKAYAEKMEKGNWDDPLLKQVLPIHDENVITAGFVSDPVGDLNAQVSNGLLKKYHGRVLLVTTAACAVHCRYCFRKEFPYTDSTPDKKQWQTTLDNIAADESINEVILSGGDPLMIPDERLRAICEDLVAISHITTLRFHSRVPVFIPERINNDFLHWLQQLDCQKVMVIHSNHAKEIDEKVGGCLLTMNDAGMTVLNQAVLLKGINDDVKTLENLSRRLFEFKVLPYYLHQLDRVHGTAHFEVEKNNSIQILKLLKNRLPGYLVPKLVGEISGERSKQAIE